MSAFIEVQCSDCGSTDFHVYESPAGELKLECSHCGEDPWIGSDDE